jgi:starch phosphorylase
MISPLLTFPQVNCRLHDVLSKSLAPRLLGHGVPRRWIEMVRHTLQTLGPKVLASWMVRD